MKNKQKTYNGKCRFYCIRLRKGQDAKYIDFLDTCKNKTGFLRQAIDNAIEKISE